MQSQERDLIAGLFGRLQPFESQPRDADAEAMIKDFVVRQPASPYLFVQTILVQEQALKQNIPTLHNRINELGLVQSGIVLLKDLIQRSWG